MGIGRRCAPFPSSACGCDLSGVAGTAAGTCEERGTEQQGKNYWARAPTSSRQLTLPSSSRSLMYNSLQGPLVC